MRIQAVKEKMSEIGIEGLVVTDMKNIYYLTGFSGTAGTIFLTKNKDYFMTDDRYIEYARSIVAGLEIVQTRSAFAEIGKLAENLGKVGFEDSADYASFEALQAEIKSELVPTSNLFWSIRQIKEDSEIERIRKACEISDRAFHEVLNFIKPGVEEIEVANFLDFKMREFGASGVSFETIVASGKRSSLPHGVASHKIIEDGDPVTMDFGCFYNHYASDMTRTVFVGSVDDKMKEIYEITLAANEALIAKVRAGLSYADWDKIPRDVITKAGYGDYFTHGIGHGFGLDIHEIPLPDSRGNKIVENADKFVQENMLITDEPGIYIPDFGGVRIEDDILVTATGCEVTTKAPKNLIVI